MTHRHEDPRRRGFDEHFVQTLSKIFRDLALFTLGAVGFVHELLRHGDARAPILIMCGALLGLPVIIRGDEKRQGAKSNDTPSESG